MISYSKNEEEDFINMEDGNLFVQIGFLVFLIFVNAFFAASEMAIVTLNDNKIKKMA